MRSILGNTVGCESGDINLAPQAGLLDYDELA